MSRGSLRLAVGILGVLPVLSLGAVASSRAEDDPGKSTDAGSVNQFDIPYATVNGTELKLDIMAPRDKSEPCPAVMVIHGGAWRAGDKKDCRFIMVELVKRGYVTISPQYRFCPKETFPAQVQDVKTAVRWVKAHAKEYNLDPNRVGAMGFSAGGHLALMLGLTAPSDGLEGAAETEGPDTRVKAVVNFFGPTDLGANDIPEISKPLVKDFLGATAADRPELAAKASPLTYVSKDDAPVLTFQGTKDPLVPPTQATKLAEAMTAAGVPGRVELLLGEKHGWGEPELGRTKVETFSFLDRYLRNGQSK